MIKIMMIILLLGKASEATSIKNNKLWYIILDVSSSIDKEQRITYCKWFRKVMEKIIEPKDGSILILRIIQEVDNQSQAKSGTIEFNEIPEPTPWETTHKSKMMMIERKKKIDELVDDVCKQLKDKKSKQTPILWSLYQTSKDMKQFAECSEKNIIIFSDMQEVSSIANFENNPLDDRDVQKILNNIQKIGIIPELNSVKILIAGALSSDERRSVEIEKFWREYFKKSNVFEINFRAEY